MNYVIYHDDTSDKKGAPEVYVHCIQGYRSTLVEITDKVSEAMKFDSARDAYDAAAAMHLDWWRVGAR